MGLTVSAFEITGTQGIIRRKAVKGEQFKIYHIVYSTRSVNQNNLKVIDFLVEDELTVLELTKTGGLLADFDCNVEGVFNFDYSLGYETKYFSIGTENTNAFTGTLFIMYELVPISKLEALMEWFRKGR